MTSGGATIGERWRRQIVRVRRHIGWARREGVGRLVEEDQLDPRVRRRMVSARRAWVAANPGRAPNARAVFLLGVQRSGTNMLVRGFEASPSFDVANENDPRAFDRFLLRPLDQVRAFIESSPHEHVLCKPLAESHRALELLTIGTPTPPVAVWAWRDVDDRVRSAVSKFGPNNLLALRAVVDDQVRSITVEGPSQEMVDLVRRGLSEDAMRFLRSLDLDGMDAEGGAAAFWYVRNLAYFELGLDRRPDVMLVSYDQMVADPEPTMRRLCDAIEASYDAALIDGMAPRGDRQRRALPLPAAVRAACDELTARLIDAGASSTPG